MHLLILSLPAAVSEVEAALDAADPVGAPYTLTRQVSRSGDQLVHYYCGHMARPRPDMAQALIDGVAGVEGGLIVVLERETVADALAALGVGHRLRPDLPEDPPSRHADLDALDAERGVTTSGTIAERWEAHQQDSRRVREADSGAISREDGR